MSEQSVDDQSPLPHPGTVSSPGFAELLDNNRHYAERVFPVVDGPFDGIAHAGIAILTCMDSRIEPLSMVGLQLGDAKLLRTPGGQLTPEALIGCILGVHLLNVHRIMVVIHTRCAMHGDDESLRAKARVMTGVDLDAFAFGAIPDQEARLRRDVARLRAEPTIEGLAEIGGFRYDVDTGLLEHIV